MFLFPGRNSTARAGAKPVLVPRKDRGKKKELDEIAMETLRRVIDNSEKELEPGKLDPFQKKQFDERIHDTLLELLEEEGRLLSQGDKQKVIRYVSDEIFGYGPITPLLQDPDVTEIMVNGYANVYAEQKGKIRKTEITFRDNNHVLHAINKIITPLGRRIDESSPTVDARLPDGSRVNAIIPPLALGGPSLTIRKFASKPFTADDLISHGTMSKEMALFLAACVRSRVNIVVSGGTGSGKTTTLNVLSSFIPGNERIVTIEDTAELQLQQDHLVTLESRPANIEGKGQFTIRELVVNSLRMRPDRIIIGEVRGGEALDMLQAMNTGHDGSISTLHANSPKDAVARLETMVLMAGMELPLRAIREQVGSAIEIIVQQDRFSDGSRKITRISAVAGMKEESLILKDIFVFQQSSIDENGSIAGEHLATGYRPPCLEKLQAHGESIVTDGTINWETNVMELPAWKNRSGKGGEKKEKRFEVLSSSRSPVVREREIFPYRAESGQFISTALQLADDEQADMEISKHKPEELWEKEWENERVYAEEEGEDEAVYQKERELLPYPPEEKRARQEKQAWQEERTWQEKMARQDKPAWPVREKEGRPAAGERQTGGIVRGVGSREAIFEEGKTSSTAGKNGGNGTFPTDHTEVSSPREGKGGRALATSIPPGRRGITLSVNEVNGLYGYLQPGDKVDVLVIYHDQAAHEQLSARTAAQSAIVLDIRESSKSGKSVKETEATLFSVTLAVTPAQAEALAYAGFKGSFYLSLCPDSFFTDGNS